jgi:putative sterol carrier protein
MAEAALVSYAEKHSLNLSILRPGIIVGDSVHGYIPKLNTIYNFIVPLVRIRNSVDSGRLWDDYMNVTKSGLIHLPLMLPGFEDTKLNLVPVDFVVQMLSHIVESKKKGVHIYHVVDNNPPSMRDMVRHVSEMLGISGIAITSPEYYFHAKKTGLNEGLVPLNRKYVSYSTSRALHDSSNLDRIKPDYCSAWDRRELISQMIEFTKKKISKDKTEKDRDSHEDIVAYFEIFLKKKRGQQLIKNLTTFTSSFEIAFSDIPGTRWSIGIERGILVSVSDNGHKGKPDCRYLVSSSAFKGITQGYMSPQECFFKGDVDIQGDIKHGLKLASLMDIFFKAHPYTSRDREASVNEAAGQSA